MQATPTDMDNERGSYDLARGEPQLIIFGDIINVDGMYYGTVQT